MSILELEDYAAELERANKGKRLKQFDAIKQELRFPWYDDRKPLGEPTAQELFTLITGETDQTLHVGMRVGCQVLEVRDKWATVTIENGMRGNLNINNVADSDVKYVDDVLKV